MSKPTMRWPISRFIVGLYVRAFLLALVLWCVLFLILMIAGCGGLNTVGPSNVRDEMFLAEVDACAKVLGVKVHGEIMTDHLPVACPNGADGCYYCGVYLQGTAYAAEWCMADFEQDVYSLDLADHETAHALSPLHDAIHNKAMQQCIEAR